MCIDVYVKMNVEARNKLAQMKPLTCKVLIAITCHMDINNTSFPSWNLLEKETGLCRTSISNGIKELETNGWITVQRTDGISSRYTLNPKYFMMGDEDQSILWTGTPDVLDESTECTGTGTRRRLPPVHGMDSKNNQSKNNQKEQPKKNLTQPRGCGYCNNPSMETKGVHFLMQKAHDGFKKLRGECPASQNKGRDYKIFRELLDLNYTEQEIINRYAAYLKSDDEFITNGGYSIPIFKTKFDTFSSNGKKPQGNGLSNIHPLDTQFLHYNGHYPWEHPEGAEWYEVDPEITEVPMQPYEKLKIHTERMRK